MPQIDEWKILGAPTRFGLSFSAGSTKPWNIAHYVSLFLLALLFIKLGSSQWFFYDEWSMLLDENQWKVFEPHNGHLSFSLTIAFSIVRWLFGLGSYWPFLALVLLAHLAAVHMMWRILNRQGTSHVVALSFPIIFGLLGVGAENTLWAFQVGFIAPIALGYGALLVADTDALNWNRRFAIVALLGFALSFASTAIPFIVATLALILTRSGWKQASGIAAIIGIPYLIWRIKSHAGESTTGFEAHTAHQFFVDVPNYVVHSFVDGLSKVAPVEAISAAAVCGALLLALWFGSARKFNNWPVRYFLAGGALLFAVLTAISRVGYGPDGASSGRYVYVLAAMTFPAIAYSIGKFSSRSVFSLIATLVSIAVVALFNGTFLVENARNQAAIEQLTKLEVIATASLFEDPDIDDGAQFSPILAPQITVGDLRKLWPMMNIGPVEADPGALLSVQTALLIHTEPNPNSVQCGEPQSQEVSFLPEEQRLVFVSSNNPITVTLTTERAGVTSAYTRLQLNPGAQSIVGLDNSGVTLQAEGAVLCRIVKSSSETGSK